MKKLLFLLLFLPTIVFGQAVVQQSKTPSSGTNAGNSYFSWYSGAFNGYFIPPFGTNATLNRAADINGLFYVQLSDSSIRFRYNGNWIPLGKSSSSTATYFSSTYFAGAGTFASPLTIIPNSVFPSQTGKAGYVLTTNGTNTLWSDSLQYPIAIGNNSASATTLTLTNGNSSNAPALQVNGQAVVTGQLVVDNAFYAPTLILPTSVAPFYYIQTATNDLLFDRPGNSKGILFRDSTIYTTDGTSLPKSRFLTTADIPSIGGGTTTNAVTFNNSGSGATSGTTFNGSVARTISYNTIGAAPTGGGTLTNTLTFGTGLVAGSYNNSASVTEKVDTTVIQTVANFFPKGDTRYLKSSVFNSLTQYSVPIATGSGITQDNSNFYYNYSTHQLSVGTNGDFTGTNAINIYGQLDAYEPQSSIGGVTSGTAYPGVTASTSRGTGASPSVNSSGDNAGGFSGWIYTGASPGYIYAAGMSISAQGSSSSLGGQLDFYTKADGSTTTTSALTITPASVIKINALTTNGLLKTSGGTGTLVIATAGTDYLTSANFIWSETPTGSINSSNTSFTLANTPVTGTIRLYWNGVRTTKFTNSGTGLTTTFTPNTGDTLLVDYQK